ncbi:hypothetical protein TMatcc_002291 [Talaromyces marneffei ATCC 18224]|uniref:IgE-binding protein n=2 Tax=Talaromyces marneffei TaxID=37727 RepID=B6QJ84_TALMQ|nr:uncharacterized protein EYB26_006546 [Talaromyces marneffei]EEA23424.1 conserved hypothetical protein [Talaromyces marneffei ATCC 18224]KAE8552269.1 hypothetical protein EYB25_006163 [Talaromyces marneffei]QGA18861.1 hypothetical protein EYB26_006546 [Talaromyces marneffei]
MLKLITLLGLSALASAQVFSGQGKLVPAIWARTLTLGDAVGCLTDTGLWTTDSANCGTFTGNATIENGNVTSTLLSTSAGSCGIIWRGNNNNHLSYACGSPDADSPTPSFVYSITNKPFLGFGQYAYLGVTGGNPPTGNDTSSLHIAGDVENGNLWVLTWEAL